MIQVAIAGLGILGPGLEGWSESAPILRGDKSYVAGELELVAPSILSPRERRRSGPVVRLALNVAQQAVEHSGIVAHELAAVFGCSAGSGLEVHQILDSLTQPGMPVSPTQFHNSVHNAAVGYWCIGASCHQASTSIAAFDYSFPAALLKAAAQTVTEDRPLLLCVYDCPFPYPLHGKRAIFAPLGVALVLTPKGRPGGLKTLSVDWRPGDPPEALSSPSVETLHSLWQGNPAGRALPLFEALAIGEPASVSLRYPDQGNLRLELTSC